MKKLLVVIDMQNDFIDGSLGTPEAQAIVPNVVREIKEYGADGIIYTLDTHYNDYFNTLEGQKLPVPHCILDSKGREINKEVWNALVEVHNPRNCGLYAIHKDTFGAHMNEWEDALDVDEFDLGEIEIIGLCTDVCVISNALILRAMFPDTIIKVKADCCAGVTPESHKNALNAMKMCQIDVIGE